MDALSFVSGMISTGVIFLIVDLYRTKKSLKDSKEEAIELKKRLKSTKEKKKGKKSKTD